MESYAICVPKPLLAVDMVKAVHNLLVRSEEAQMASGVPPLRFSSPIEVEHIARCMRNTDAYGNLVEEWLVTALVVLHEGIAQFPDCTRLHMAYGNFIASVMENHQLAAEQFTSVRRSPINVDLQFQCFCRNREQAQSAGSSSSADGAMDLVSGTW